MENLGLDPLDLANLPLLRPKIRQMLFEDHYGKKEYIATLNDKQIFDKLIETRIESKIVSKSLSFDSTSNIERLEVRPAFIMNHPLLMSPLAKSHA
jgi:lysyl-tRNA synthetase class II